MSPAPPACRDGQRRGGRVVEGARLESVFTGNRIGGSNPALSAIPGLFASSNSRRFIGAT